MAHTLRPHDHPLSELLARTCANLALDPSCARSEVELANCVRRGFPAASIDSLLSRGIPDADIFKSVIPRRTFQRRRAENENLTPDESDRAERFARTLALATLVFGDEARAAGWLTHPKTALENNAPVEMLGSSVGAKAVEDLLLQSYFGIVA